MNAPARVTAIPWCTDIETTARRFGPRIAITSGAVRLTYRTLADRAQALAANLLARGIAPGDRVATLLPNGTDAVWASYGVTMSGAAETPLAPAYSRDELQWCSTLAGVSLIVTDHGGLEVARALGVPALDVATIEARSELIPGAPGGAWGRIVFTSGSTGRPKAIVYTHARRWLAHIMLKATLPFHPAPGARLLAMTPFTHGAALLTYVWIDHGGEVCLLRGVEPGPVGAALAAGVDALFAPPTVIAKLAELFPDRHFDGVRCLFTGTQTLTPGLYAKARTLFGPCVRVTYGKSENLNPITVLEAADAERVYRDESTAEGACLGWPASGVELDIREGEILLRSQHMAVGHIDASGFHAWAADEWHATGDSGRIDDHGRLWLIGRLADVVKTGGYKVYPQEIELALSGVDGCGHLAVTSLPSDYWGEVIIAAAEGVSDHDAWQRACEQRLATLSKHKHPRVFIAVDTLPRTAQGKIARAAVRAAILERYELSDGPYPRVEPKV